MEKNYKYKFATKEDKQFNDFLNKTIIGTSYNFFNKWKEYRENTEEYKEDILIDCSEKVGLFQETENEFLSVALKSLTKNERLVISFIFDEHLKGEEISKRLKINPNTVYIIKKRALNKIEKIIKEAEENGSY